MTQNFKILITGTRKGIGEYLAKYYLDKKFTVIGCSRGDSSIQDPGYFHYKLDIADEKDVTAMFKDIRKKHSGLDVLINNAGVASMNHSMLTPMVTVERILRTNVIGSFLFCREAAKLMSKKKYGRIINFGTVATPLNLEGESIYAASKAAVVSLTKILAKEYSGMGITVNAIGPTPIKTDLIRAVPQDKLNALINQQTIKRYGELSDISNVIDFYIQPESNFITGQTIYLGGI